MAVFTGYRPHEADVLIIGGGIAGIAAARDVTRAGRTAVILEASDRLGGRTWTTDRFGTYVELGGTDVHWLQPHVWAEVTRYGLEIEEFAPPEDVVLLEHDTVKTIRLEELFERMERGMSRLAALAREVYERPHDPRFDATAARLADQRSLAEELATYGLSEDERVATEAYWAAAYQGPLSGGALTLALRWLALAGWDWTVMLDLISRYKLVGGTRHLVEAMHEESKAPVIYNSLVTKIESSDSSVTVTCDDGQVFTGRAVICAAPLNCLDDIMFEPALPPSTAELLRDGQVSRGLKVVVKVKGEPQPYMAVAPATSQLVLCQYDRALGDGSHLATVFGALASELDGDDPAAVQAAMRQWFPDIEVEDVAHYPWTTSELSRGTWAVPRVNQFDALCDIADLEGRLVFAGADIAAGSYALIDGAIDTGMRAARKVESLLAAESNPLSPDAARHR